MANPFAWLWRRKESTIQVPVDDTDIGTMYPQGFFRVVNLSGTEAGTGFYCRKCKLHIRHSAPATIFHCGANDTMNPKASLPTVKLTSPHQPPTIAGRTLVDPEKFAGWDGVVEYGSNGAHSDDPFEGGVGFNDPSSGAWRK